MKNLVLAAVLTTALSGCASSFNIGEKDLSGPVPQGFACADGVQAMDLTNDYQNGDSLDVDLCNYEKKGRKSKKNKNQPKLTHEVSAFGGTVIPDMNVIDDPKPVLMPAQVMRIWVNAYETDDGSLAYPGRIFTEITPRKWNVGYSAQKGMNGNRTISPLMVRVEETIPTENSKSTANSPEQAADAAAQNPEQGSANGTDGKALEDLNASVQELSDKVKNFPEAPLGN
jgi:pilus biogenesis protein